MTMSISYKWPEVTLGDYVDLLAGFAFKSSEFTDNPNDVHLVKGANVHQGYIDWPDSKYWPRNEFEKYQKFALRENDVVIAMDRPWIEAGLKYSWIKPGDPQSLLVQRVSRLRGINGLRTDYVRYLIGSSNFTSYIKPIVTGVTVPHISPTQIKDFRFRLPPLETQLKIASILSAYDELIENNTRRIKILEEMARMIYREWFVNFRFPGHEKVKMVDSPIGKIPEGWEVKCLRDFGPVITGKTPSTKVPENFGSFMPFIKTPDMHGHMFCIETGEALSELGVDCQRNKTLPPNTLCVSCIGTAGVVTLTTVPAQTNQQINSIILNSQETREFLYFALLDLKEVINQYGANGATMVNLNKGKFEALEVISPSGGFLNTFHRLVAPYFEEIKVLQKKNQNLRQTRELLLPKLISGEVAV